MTLPACSMLGATARKVSSEVFLLLGRPPMPAIGRHRIGRPRPTLRLGRDRRCGQRERRRACPTGGPCLARFYGIDARRPSPFLAAGFLRWRDSSEATRNPQQARSCPCDGAGAGILGPDIVL